MLGTRLNAFAQAGINHTEGRLALAEETLKQANTTDVHLPAVSSSTGAAMTTIIRGR